ncbi:MAG: acyl carrier protein [Magnetococcales bacterium]|nr:acyl carrier protein [Magnetococcales bacterium]NGZ25649.1 acyl carrier protein [Magnetococcales bacterium]
MSDREAEIYRTLQSIFDDLFLAPVTLTPELSARDVEEWDSVMHISLLLATEQAFSIRFRVGQTEAMANVGEFVALIDRMLDHA